MLSNMLLVLGMCFFLGGIFNMRDENGVGREQTFAPGTAQTTCSLMALALASAVIPTTLFGVIVDTEDDGHQARTSILALSRGISAILLLLYCLYLFFALYTHKHLFEPQVPDSLAEPENANSITLNPWSSSIVLLITTIIISYCASYMVGSIDNLVETANLSKKFIGLILIPIVGNAAEHATACVVAIKDKMDLAMAVAIGSTIQIALLATPALVMVGWATGRAMSLHFELCKYLSRCSFWRVKSTMGSTLMVDSS